MFFTCLSLFLILRLIAQPSPARYLLAGGAVGLAIATKYTLGILLVLLLIVTGLNFWRQIRAAGRLDLGDALRTHFTRAAAGLFAAGLVFALSTPYFFLDRYTALADLSAELRSTHLGADGLSFSQNLWWYLSDALPQALSWPLALAGLALIVRDLLPERLYLAGFAGLFLFTLSLSPLHWRRWLIPVVPLFTIIAAVALLSAAGRLGRHFSLPLSLHKSLIFSLALLISVVPGYRVALQGYQKANPSTQVLARQWVLEHLPAGSRLAQERYTALLTDGDFAGYVMLDEERLSILPARSDLTVLERRSLAEAGDLEQYTRQGYRYLVASSYMYDRFLAEPERYQREARFYNRLFKEGQLLRSFTPSLAHPGPEIRIYRLQPP